MFQFLIGRLETSPSSCHIKLFCEFQFLIGRLETFGGGVGNQILTGFQFLIGRLETITKTYSFLALRIVSIPHRKARNDPLPLMSTTFALGFNSS